MPVSRKPAAPVPEATDRLRLVAATLPRKIVVVVIVRDESGSMSKFRQRQGEFIPALQRHLVDAAGPKAADLVYVLYAVVSGGVATTEFAPLSRAAEPDYQVDGETPLGTAFSAVAEKFERFFEDRVFPDEVTVRDFQVLVFSDLYASGEKEAETQSGIARFAEAAKKYRAKVQVVAPEAGAVSVPTARALGVPEGEIKFLDADPKAVLTVTFDSLLQASRKVTGSKPLRPRQ